MSEEERELQAAEYVLGTLESENRQSFAAALADDAALQELVADWQQRLAQIDDTRAGIEPPARVWDAIDAAIDREAGAAAARTRLVRADKRRWRRLAPGVDCCTAIRCRGRRRSWCGWQRGHGCWRMSIRRRRSACCWRAICTSANRATTPVTSWSRRPVQGIRNSPARVAASPTSAAILLACCSSDADRAAPSSSSNFLSVASTRPQSAVSVVGSRDSRDLRDAIGVARRRGAAGRVPASARTEREEAMHAIKGLSASALIAALATTGTDSGVGGTRRQSPGSADDRGNAASR